MDPATAIRRCIETPQNFGHTLFFAGKTSEGVILIKVMGTRKSQTQLANLTLYCVSELAAWKIQENLRQSVLTLTIGFLQASPMEQPSLKQPPRTISSSFSSDTNCLILQLLNYRASGGSEHFGLRLFGYKAADLHQNRPEPPSPGALPNRCTNDGNWDNHRREGRVQADATSSRMSSLDKCCSAGNSTGEGLHTVAQKSAKVLRKGVKEDRISQTLGCRKRAEALEENWITTEEFGGTGSIVPGLVVSRWMEMEKRKHILSTFFCGGAAASSSSSSMSELRLIMKSHGYKTEKRCVFAAATSRAEISVAVLGWVGFALARQESPWLRIRTRYQSSNEARMAL
ncbi:hypothetical protein B0H13DRAFT_1864681 [Mycena leptocephala]|nr:hypothetical protein B0H13DRAFT_1864681 [Mycena leptocephala]